MNDEAAFWEQVHAERDHLPERTRNPDPVERCPACSGALTRQSSNHAGLDIDGHPQQFQYRRCVTCLRVARRDNSADGWQPWYLVDEDSLTGFHKQAVSLL
jgi:hypothetical protein